MRNLKVNILILMLLSVFACDTQKLAEDQTPEITNITSDKKVEPINPGEKSGFTMIITVQYPTGWDRVALRSQIGPVLGMTSWSPCFRPDAETWIVNLATEAQFLTLLTTYNMDARSVGSAGGEDPYAKNPLFPIFFYANLCE